MSPRRAPWSALLPIGLALYAANHAVVGAIRRVAYDLDVLLPAYAAVSVVLAVWYAWWLRALSAGRDDAVGDLEWPLRGGQIGLILCGTALIGLHVSSLPQGSIDAVTYALHGYFQVEQGLDPYSAVPATALEGELGPALAEIGYNASHRDASPYGPLWSHIEVAIWWCTRDLRLALHTFQALAIGALAACAWLMVRLARAQRTGLAPRAVALAFLLNPLVLIESVWDAHLDVTAYALVLAALLSVARAPRRWWWALLAALAINIKLLYILFLPILIARASVGRDWRALLRATAGATLVLLATSAVLYAPYWNGLETLASLRAHAQRDAVARFVAPLAAALAIACALREFQRRSPPGSLATALPMTLIGGAYWLPWHSIAAVGELLRLGARGFAYVVVITLVGRLGTGVYFTAIQHYGPRVTWPSALQLPGGLYRAALAALLVVFVVQSLRGARRRRLQGLFNA